MKHYRTSYWAFFLIWVCPDPKSFPWNICAVTPSLSPASIILIQTPCSHPDTQLYLLPAITLVLLTLVTGSCHSTASLCTWRSPVHRPRRCHWPEGCLAPCPRWRLRWIPTMKTQILTLEADTGITGTWAAKQHYNVESLVVELWTVWNIGRSISACLKLLCC